MCRRVITTTQRELGWDELVFATGSTPFIPPYRGTTAACPWLSPYQRCAGHSGRRRPAVVLGGGVLGVEAAAALRRHGDNVTLVHRGEWLMEQQLDARPGLLAAHLRARHCCELSASIAALPR
jgi:nitrite reductase (NADH) large subunit